MPMEKPRITIQISNEDLTKIQTFIKNQYPKFKTVSEVIRTALKRFLGDVKNEKEAN